MKKKKKSIFEKTALSVSPPSVRFLAVLDLGFDVSCVVMIASKHIPGDFEWLGGVHRLKSVLMEETDFALKKKKKKDKVTQK